jgi:DNA invertase Pin-like site-specific DNA recombinase
MQLETGTPTGKLMLNVLGSVAQFEREVMLERQCEGIAKAKAETRYKGRAPTARAKAAEVRQLAATGMSKAKVAAELGNSRARCFECFPAPVETLSCPPTRQRLEGLGFSVER